MKPKPKKVKEKRQSDSNSTYQYEDDVTIAKRKSLKSYQDTSESESNDFSAAEKTLKNSQMNASLGKKRKAQRNTDSKKSSFRSFNSRSVSENQDESDTDYSRHQKSLLKSHVIKKRKPKRTKDIAIAMPNTRMSNTSSESEGQSESDIEYYSGSDTGNKCFKLIVDAAETGDRDEQLKFSVSDEDDDNTSDDDNASNDDSDDDDSDDDAVGNFKGQSKRYLHKNVVNKRRNEQDSDKNIEDNSKEDSEEDSDIEKDDVENPGEQIEADMEDEEDKFTAIRKELADIPFEDLLKIKEKVGVKVFNKIIHGKMEDKPKQTSFKRTNKNRPREMSSKKPVSRFKRSKEKLSWVARDPRFDDLSGQFREYHFNKNYSFIEDIKEKERQTVKKEMKRSRNDEKKKDLKNLLGRMEQEQKVQAMKKQKQDLEKTYREKERELVKEGKTPYFLKKSDKKTLELAMKFKELKQSGKLEHYMSKKRKKVAQKQRKKMPSKPC